MPRFNLKTVSAGIEIPYSDKIFFILRRYVEVYPNICPILMGFLYFYLSMGHFEITVVTNSSDLWIFSLEKKVYGWETHSVSVVRPLPVGIDVVGRFCALR